MKILMLLALLPFSVLADVTWIQSSVSLTAITPGGVPFESSESMTLETQGTINAYQTFCSKNRAEAESDASTGTINTTIGDYAWFAYKTLVPGTIQVATTRSLGVLRGEGINLAKHTIYCVIHPSGVAVSDKNIKATGLIINADLATVPMPMIEFPQNKIDLGQCMPTQTLKKDVVSSISYRGYGVNQTSSVAWAITSATTNPDDSLPTVSINGSSVSPVNVPLLEGPVDPGISLSYSCNTPGEYTWNMIFTYTIL